MPEAAKPIAKSINRPKTTKNPLKLTIKANMQTDIRLPMIRPPMPNFISFIEILARSRHVPAKATTKPMVKMEPGTKSGLTRAISGEANIPKPIPIETCNMEARIITPLHNKSSCNEIKEYRSAT